MILYLNLISIFFHDRNFDCLLLIFNFFLAYWPRGDSGASSLFGGMPGGYGLGAHHLPSAYAMLGRGGTAPGFGGHSPATAPPPPPPPYSHASLGTLSVAASQAASLGNYLINYSFNFFLFS